MQNSLTNTDIKQVNKLEVLKFVISQDETTKPVVSKNLGISPPTVSTLVNELIKDNLIKIRGRGSSTEQGGKRPQMLAFNSVGRGIISIHVGVKMIEGALIDLKANIIFQVKENISHLDGKEKIYALINKIISRLIKESEDVNIPLLGIGVSCLGLVDTKKGTIINSVHFNELNDFNLGELLSNQFSIPVILGNECQNLALAEKLFGFGKKINTFVSVLTDTGIGAGIIIENQIFRGIDNSFGEIGHTTINIEGTKCHCGNNGCWETYASSSALIKKVMEDIEETSVLKEIIQKEGTLQISHIVDAINKGDKKVEQLAIKELGRYLGIGLANIVNTINPELIIIHGEIIQLGEKLQNEIQNWVKLNALSTPASRVKIRLSTLGTNANILGAGALVITELFEKPDYLFHSF